MDEARACIAYSKNNQIMVRNHPVLINYSTSEKIQRGGLEGEDPNKVIVLTISNVTYPITVETLKEVSCFCAIVIYGEFTDLLRTRKCEQDCSDKTSRGPASIGGIR